MVKQDNTRASIVERQPWLGANARPPKAGSEDPDQSSWIALRRTRDDVDEKNAQVPRIKSFFSTAELTLVYLRKYDQLMGMAIYTICALAEMSNRSKGQLPKSLVNILPGQGKIDAADHKWESERTKPNESIDHEIEDDYIQSHHFLRLQYSSRGCRASDPRDHVFALLGIAEGGGQKMPIADYSHSLAEVYVRMAWTWFMIRKKRPLSWLGCVNNSYDATDLPTWIPDWRGQWDGIPLVLGTKEVFLGASGLKKLEGCHIQFRELSTPMTLPLRVQIRGCRVLQMKAVEPLKSSSPGSWQTAQHAEHINEFPEPYPTTYLSYGRAFKQAVEPDQEKGFPFQEPRSESFWAFRHAGVKRPRLRPIFAMEMEGRKVASATPVNTGHGEFEQHLLHTVNSGEKRGENEPEYTQRGLYERISRAYRFHATIPQDGLVRGRSWFISEDGFMGLAPKVTRSGDAVAHFFGGITQYVLREKRREEDKTIWGFVGECFVLGLMNGEINQDMPDDVVEDFSLE
ncbi:hypothetical protein S7711_03330 [Stachybotrys chartarum IBT 7711]|uniref:Heterokaryon incompatibility domain-containing protein n=1 Tax=Stachybotrys chartarum (strain CBS 109288 / IBT 7711) TaxID=1280523 RepID=A0A084AUQ1_STACB|nr:hypothetical protein S7711_03330 [Stachybotrys chartarum IBT 7711]